MISIKELQDFFQCHKDAIKSKIDSFDVLDPKVMFARMVYCFLTPQTKAEFAKEACKRLLREDFFFCGYKQEDFFFHASQEELAICLRQSKIRFHNQKAEKLILWRMMGEDKIKTMLKIPLEEEKREFLIQEVKGIGLKEASHFLRNVGMGKDLAILDRHILRFMQENALLPKSADFSQVGKNYKKWEKIFVSFAHSQNQRAQEVDFAIWAMIKKKNNLALSDEQIFELE